MINIKPAVSNLSSWSQTRIGIESVMGLAREFSDTQNTTRTLVRASVPGSNILATTTTIGNAVETIAHDYFTRYPENNDGSPHPDYPSSTMTMDDVGYMLALCKRRGGWCRQYECVVHCDNAIEMTVLKHFRIGDQVLHYGDDDPNSSAQHAELLRTARKNKKTKL